MKVLILFRIYPAHRELNLYSLARIDPVLVSTFNLSDFSGICRYQVDLLYIFRTIYFLCNISFFHSSNQAVNIPTGNNWSDRQLVEKSLGGDASAFKLIIKNTESLLTQIIFKMIDNPEDCKDLAQDIYLKVFHKLGSFKFESKLSTWIAQIGYNTCFDYLRRKKMAVTGYEEVFASEGDEQEKEADPHLLVWPIVDRLVQKDLSAILQIAIGKLSPVYKTLIGLYHQQELSYEEIGFITGLPEGTVKSYLFRARKALKENLLIHYKKEDLW